MDVMNDYSGFASKKVVNLVRQRATRFGLRGADLQDAEQEVMVELMMFRYDKAKSNGASKLTALYAVIDNKLKHYVRGIVRYHRRVEDYRAAWGLPDPEADTPPSVEGEHQIRDFDVRLAVESLEPEMQKVCHGWLRGRSKQQITEDEGFSMNKLNRIMRDIAEVFRKNGLGRWIGE